jgi:hypothetical protein
MAAIASLWFRRKASQRLARSGSLGAPFHPTRDGSLGKVKTEHEKFPVDPRRSLGWVLSNHPKDQLPNLLRHLSSSDLRPGLGDRPPVHAKTCAVPADDGFGRNDDEGVLPSRRDPSSDYPKELIDKREMRWRMSTFQHCELLSEHEILQNKIPAAKEEANQCSDPEKKQAEHGRQLYQINDWKYCSKLLILQSPRVLANDKDIANKEEPHSVLPAMQACHLGLCLGSSPRWLRDRRRALEFRELCFLTCSGFGRARSRMNRP